MGNLKLKSCMYCFVVFIVLASCKNNKIDDLEAKKLINDALKLPRISIIYIDYGSKYNIDEYEKYGAQLLMTKLIYLVFIVMVLIRVNI